MIDAAEEGAHYKSSGENAESQKSNFQSSTKNKRLKLSYIVKWSWYKSKFYRLFSYSVFSLQIVCTVSVQI